MVQILEFEREIFAMENQIREWESLSSLSHHNEGVGDITHDIAKLKSKLRHKKRDVFNNLNGWQKTLVARHPARPYTLDYLENTFRDFVELNGDRHGGFGPSIVGGLARFEERSVMVIGHQKGRTTEEKIRRNFGMSQPEGYRKALRLMKLAEKFNLPVITLIDTPGAYPGVHAEETGQSEAIAQNLISMAGLRIPLISIVIGEGGSGGALAIGMGNRVLMLEHAVYSTISPEGCASILWKDQKKVSQAAEAMSMTAEHLLKMKIIDDIIPEPLGGAHRNHKRAAILLKKTLRKHLDELRAITPEQLVLERQNKFRAMGVFLEGQD